MSTPPLVAIREIRGAAGDGDGAPSAGGSASPRLPLVDLEVTVNADKIVRVGVPAVCDLLAKIQICKATADVERAAELFNRLTSLDDTWLEYRGVVLRKKQPRPLFVQAHTVLERQQPPNGASGGEGKAATTTTVRLVEFPGSHEGVVQSMLARYSPTADGESSDDDDD